MRKRIHEWLEPGEQSSTWEHFIDFAVLILIFVSVGVVVLQTMPEMAGYEALFDALEHWCVYFFTLEYLLRIWTCVEDPRFAHPVRGRLRYLCSAMGIIDFLALAPFYLAPFAESHTLVLRILRLIRVFKFTRYNASVGLLGRVFRSRRQELLLTVALVVTLVVISSTLVYVVEHEAQPKVFSSIPAAMWWGIVTLTTVGYGDIYPITMAGKVITGISLLLGIGLFALPAGILAGGFAEELSKHRPAPPRRICFSLRLEDRADLVHWTKPKTLDALRKAGFSNYTLFRHVDGSLIGYVESAEVDPHDALRVIAGGTAGELVFEQEILHE